MRADVTWTNLSRRQIAERMPNPVAPVSLGIVSRVLVSGGFRRRKPQKKRTMGQHKDRNAQFEKIATLKQSYLDAGHPEISIDTKKKESLRNFHRAGVTDFTSGSRYTPNFGGTSGATPLVEGVCGLVFSRNPSPTAAEVKDLLEHTVHRNLDIVSAVPVNAPGEFVNGLSQWFGHGKVNAYQAVIAALAVGPKLVHVAVEPDLPIAEDSPAATSLHVPDSGTILDAIIDLELGVPVKGLDIRLRSPAGQTLPSPR